MKPIKFAVEVVIGMAIAVAGAWLAANVGGKINDKVNRQAQAGERIAAALERAYPPPSPLPKPSLLGDDRAMRKDRFQRASLEAARKTSRESADDCINIVQPKSHRSYDVCGDGSITEMK